jgi:cell division transport system permease protein
MSVRGFLLGDVGPERVVPASGFTMTLTLAAAAAMAFLAVFVAAVAGGADRMGQTWRASLESTATVRVMSAEDEQVAAIAQLLAQTPGIESARQIDETEQVSLLEPWLGADLPLDLVALPVLFELTLTDEGPDAADLAARLSELAEGAVFDDHETWRAPVSAAADRLGAIALLSLVLIGVVTAAMIALAASASLAANRQVIDVLRLVGATDSYITRVFVRRFALRAAAGAAVGSLIGVITVALVPNSGNVTTFLSLGFQGAGWLWPFAVPVAASIIAYGATYLAARRRLNEVS